MPIIFRLKLKKVGLLFFCRKMTAVNFKLKFMFL